jgi:hypothetical protein
MKNVGCAMRTAIYPETFGDWYKVRDSSSDKDIKPLTTFIEAAGNVFPQCNP